MNEADYLRLPTRQTEQANDFLSNACKWGREHWVCQRFLEVLSVPYRQEDSAAPGERPPDVLLKGASFEVFFVLDEDRRLNKEWCEELTRRCQAVSLRQLIRHEERLQRIAAVEPQARLVPTLRKKAHNYSEHSIDHDELDLLAFVDLKRAVSDFSTSFSPSTGYLRQGWRSLSMAGPTSARVLFAHSGAPEFLRASLGRSILFDAGVGL